MRHRHKSRLQQAVKCIVNICHYQLTQFTGASVDTISLRSGGIAAEPMCAGGTISKGNCACAGSIPLVR